ncbi:hypothetical protein [Methylomonas rosea]|uniref:Uncharacterized protein n=1 Tax=Methylomonas rosea TaxID=2952227 RepID=A0ABT1TX88_9GAMM|nr:hypothetical protein [Methylomonas sp. WSC-7]MCQ8118981.1 hypothetical protein [Methylomonas sp. WSC-7]
MKLAEAINQGKSASMVCVAVCFYPCPGAKNYKNAGDCKVAGQMAFAWEALFLPIFPAGILKNSFGK